jgi:hypothetical protein
VKNIMPWIKSNTAIVVLSALILLILPAAFVGSSMWNSKIKKGREKAVTEKNSALDALKVTYTLPPAVPGGKSTEFPWPAPNKIATDFFREHRTSLDGQVKQITTVAEGINKTAHEPLLDGVFPTPANQTKTLEFTELLVGKDNKPSAYQALLDRIKAGSPADPRKVREVLEETHTQAIEQKRAAANTDKLSEEEQKELDDRLKKLRIGQYQAHARTISVYATRDCLPGSVPRTIPPEPPPVADCWRWQEDYWAIADLFRAVGEANSVNGKLNLGVDRSVVKRIDQVVVFPLDHSPDTVTGRKNSSPTRTYDVRHATLKVVASSSRLPTLINAISRTNFMTVTSVDLAEVPREVDLAKGFYYGDEHVVLATIQIETVWLRSWASTMMPEDEKKRREGAVEEQAAAAAPPPAPRPMARGMADDDGSAKAKKKTSSTKKPKKGGE